MHSQRPFSLRIFVATGDPDGLRYVEKSNWVGKALVFPRSEFQRIKKLPEFDQTGIYLLLGEDAAAKAGILYIGEGDPVRPRLEIHHSKKDFWSEALFFTSAQGQLNKAHVQYLEARLVTLAREAKRVTLDNGNLPTEPSLSLPDKADMDVFLSNMLEMMPVLGIDAFDKATSSPANDASALYMRAKGIDATAHQTTQGFVVRAGSRAVLQSTASFTAHNPGYARTREWLIQAHVLTPEATSYLFKEDYVFSSPSEAAAIIAGNAMNGRTTWKDASGKTLKQIQAEEAESSGS